jgi:hypothetical protein
MKTQTTFSLKVNLLALFIAITGSCVQAQSVGIGTPTPNENAILDLSSSNKGLLIPRMALSATNLSSPIDGFVAGMMVYNTATGGTAPNNVSPGFYFSNGTSWQRIESGWSLTGNNGTNAANNFIGTTDDQDVVFKRNNIRAGLLNVGNTSLGVEALSTNGSRNGITAIGYQSLKNFTTGNFNTSIGYFALLNNKTGFRNTAVGVSAGLAALGSGNVFLGNNAGASETGSNKLYIANADGDGSQSLIYGEFDNKKIRINEKLGVGIPPNTFPLEIKGIDNGGGSDQVKFYTADGTPRWHFSIKSTGALSYTETNVADNRLVLSPGGYIGIGNASPNAPLQFAQNASQSRKIVLYEDANNDHQFNGFGINPGILRYQVASTSASHVFYAGSSLGESTELMRISIGGINIPGNINVDGYSTINGFTRLAGTAGTVGIGTETPSNSKLSINNAGYTYALYVTGSPVRQDSEIFWTLPSDKNLKRNINEYDGGLAEIVKLKPVKYYYNEASGLDTEHEKIGLLAQDVEIIAPNMVENKLDKNGKSFKTLNLSPVLFMYINAFKELDSQNKAKDQKIADLETRLAKLEKLIGR